MPSFSAYFPFTTTATETRCVRPGGLVVVNVPAFRWLWSYHDDTCETKHRYTRPELVALFRAAGLTVDFATYANLPALPLIAARRKLLKPAAPTSDVRLYPAPVEAMFAGMAWLEFSWMRAGVSARPPRWAAKKRP